jgi:hypothetical protein
VEEALELFSAHSLLGSPSSVGGRSALALAQQKKKYWSPRHRISGSQRKVEKREKLLLFGQPANIHPINIGSKEKRKISTAGEEGTKELEGN